MKKTLVYIQGILQILVGVSAAVSGLIMMAYPSGSVFQAPPEMLDGTPFDNFLIPGLILFVVIGIGQLMAAYFTLMKKQSAALLGAVFGLGLMIWIFVQVSMIGGGHMLQYGYFFVGAGETALAFLINNSGTIAGKSNTIQQAG